MGIFSPINNLACICSSSRGTMFTLYYFFFLFPWQASMHLISLSSQICLVSPPGMGLPWHRQKCAVGIYKTFC